MRKWSEMAVLNEDESEWLVSEAIEPLQKAHDNAEQDEICVKELLMKSGVDPDTAVKSNSSAGNTRRNIWMSFRMQ